MEFIFIIFIFSGIVWILWNVRSSSRASKLAALDEAWRIVLADPNYMHRRRYEERMREDEAQLRKAEGIK
jgi:hypothetical protein